MKYASRDTPSVMMTASDNIRHRTCVRVRNQSALNRLNREPQLVAGYTKIEIQGIDVSPNSAQIVPPKPRHPGVVSLHKGRLGLFPLSSSPHWSRGPSHRHSDRECHPLRTVRANQSATRFPEKLDYQQRQRCVRSQGFHSDYRKRARIDTAE